MILSLIIFRILLLSDATVQQDVPESSCIFPSPALYSAIAQKILGSLLLQSQKYFYSNSGSNAFLWIFTSCQLSCK
jgi:hypothetical protein